MQSKPSKSKHNMSIKNKSNIHLEPIRIRIKNQNQIKKRNLPLASIENCKRIYELNKKLKLNQERFKTEIEESQCEEDKLSQIELYDVIKQTQFATIYKIRVKQTGKHYALKKIKIDDQHKTREEGICRFINNNYLVKIIDVFNSKQNGKMELNIMMDLYDWNLKDYIMKKEPIDSLIFKTICYQMTRSLLYLHSKQICHRDIKPENFLMKKNGRLALADFGSAKSMKNPQSNFSYIGSRSYRAPELHLGSTDYTTSVDIWALGCIILQIIFRKQIFQGSSTIDALLNIGRVIGTKDLKKIKGSEMMVKLMPNLKGIELGEFLSDKACPHLIDLLSKILRINQEERLKAIQILIHPFFDECRDEQTYNQIIKQKIDISDFFDFTQNQLRNYEQFRTKLIPIWKRDRPDKRVS